MKGLWRRGALVVGAGIFIFFIAYPIARMAQESLTVDGGLTVSRYAELFAAGPTAEAAANSIWMSFLSVVFSGVIGIFFAVVFTQCDFPLKKYLARLAVLPIALPPLVGVIAFLFVFGESGILPRSAGLVTGAPPEIFALDGMSAIVFVHAYSFYVYFYLFVSDTLRSLDGSLLDAASGLGATPWRTFRRVILPELRAPIAGAALLTFMASMASFTAPLMFAGGKRFLTLQIYNTKLNGDIGLAAAQSMFLALVSVLAFVILTRRQGMGGSGRGKQSRPARALAFRPAFRRVMIVLVLVLLAFELLPLLTIVLISFAREGSWTTQIFPSSYTPENYLRLFSDPSVLQPIQNSFLMATIALAACAVFGTAAAYGIVKGGMRSGRVAAEIVLGLPYALPGTVIAIGLILTFSTPHWFTGSMALAGSFWILPLAYFIRQYPLVVRSAASALEGIDEALLEAGKVFGAGSWRRFRVIVLPLILPGVISGSVLVFIAALGEFVSSVLLYAYASRPISVEIFSQLRMFSFGSATAYSVMLLLMILASIAGADWLTGKLTRNRLRS